MKYLATSLHPRNGVRDFAAATVAFGMLAGCVIPAPLVDTLVFDSAPFYFPDGLVPDPSTDLVLDLAAADEQTFDVQVYEWDPDDTLTYRWTFVSSDFSGELGSGELDAPIAVGDAWVHQVPAVRVSGCGEFLRRDGDVLLLRLEVVDEIPATQRFDENAEDYSFVVDWRIVASGECR